MEPTVNQVSQQSNWPGAFKIFKPSRSVVGFNIWPYLATLILSGTLSGGVGSDGEYSTAIVVGQIVGFLISIYFTVSNILILLNASKSVKTGFVESLKKAAPYYFNMLGTILLLALLSVVTLLALIIPFFIIMPRLIMAPYLVVDKNMGAIESLKASWNATKGHLGKVYGIIGASILMSLPIITIIGIPVSIYLLVAYGAAPVLLYRYVTNGVVNAPVKQEIDVPYPTAPSTNA